MKRKNPIDISPCPHYTSDMANPKGRVNITWSPNFAYAIGLLVTDGNLSRDGRHFSFTSKDLELVHFVQQGLGVTGHIGRKARGAGTEKSTTLFKSAMCCSIVSCYPSG